MSWKTTKLDSLCKMHSGGTPCRGKKTYYSGDIPWAKISDIETAKCGVIYNTEEKITQEGLNAINNRIFEKGTLLLAMYGSVGKVAFAGTTMSTNQAILGIKIRDTNLLDYSYLKYWFQTIKSQLLDRAVGGTLQNISLGIVKDLEIPLPPLATQKRIAEILDAADALRRKDQELLKKYDELAQAIFIDMFGDIKTNSKNLRETTFKEICVLSQGLQIPISERKKEAGANRFPYISNQFLNGGKVAEYVENPRENVVCEIDDVLMTRTGNTGVVLTDVSGVFHNNFFKISYDKNIINKRYLVEFLKNPFIKSIVLKMASTTTIPDLNHGDFYRIKFLLPEIELQNTYGTFIKEQINLKNSINLNINQSSNLFNSLIQKAFNGELVA